MVFLKDFFETLIKKKIHSQQKRMQIYPAWANKTKSQIFILLCFLFPKATFWIFI